MLGKMKIEENKSISINDKLIEYMDMDKVYIPLANYDNLECKPTVIKGDKVKVGTVVGKRSDHFKLPIHSSVSGIVLDIEEMLHVSGEKVKCIVIENDKLYTEENNEQNTVDMSKYTKEELQDILKRCGIVGMGGSGFPTYVKYDPAIKYDKLLVNAVECEPFITADYILIKNYSKKIITVLVALKNILNLSEITIAIKKNNDLYSLLNEYTKDYPYIKVYRVKNLYPSGWEKGLIKEVYGIKYKKLPLEKGIVVNNVSTIYSMYDALKHNKPVTKRIVTLTGERMKEPMNVIVRTGTLMSELIEYCSGYTGTGEIHFIAGGPLTGKGLENDNLVMSKNLNCVLLKDVVDEIDTMCMRCGKCSKACPVKISPVLIKGNSNIKELKKLHPEKCIECGLCSYVCPANLELKDQVLLAKDKVRQVK